MFFQTTFHHHFQARNAKISPIFHFDRENNGWICHILCVNLKYFDLCQENSTSINRKTTAIFILFIFTPFFQSRSCNEFFRNYFLGALHVKKYFLSNRIVFAGEGDNNYQIPPIQRIGGILHTKKRRRRRQLAKKTCHNLRSQCFNYDRSHFQQPWQLQRFTSKCKLFSSSYMVVVATCKPVFTLIQVPNKREGPQKRARCADF